MLASTVTTRISICCTVSSNVSKFMAFQASDGVRVRYPCLYLLTVYYEAVPNRFVRIFRGAKVDDEVGD